MRQKLIEIELFIKLNKDDFMKFIQVDENSSVYGVIMDSYEILEFQIQKSVKAKARYMAGHYKKQDAYYVMITLGKQIDELLTQKNSDGQFLEAYLLNAMADWYLFLADEKLKSLIYRDCDSLGWGIVDCLEPFDKLHPKELENILTATKGKEWGISVTKGFMCDPQKTMAYVMLVDINGCHIQKKHSCSLCNRLECTYRTLNGNNN